MFGSFSELFTGWGGSSYYRYRVAYVARLESLVARRCLVIYIKVRRTLLQSLQDRNRRQQCQGRTSVQRCSVVSGVATFSSNAMLLFLREPNQHQRWIKQVAACPVRRCHRRRQWAATLYPAPPRLATVAAYVRNATNAGYKYRILRLRRRRRRTIATTTLQHYEITYSIVIIHCHMV